MEMHVSSRETWTLGREVAGPDAAKAFRFEVPIHASELADDGDGTSSVAVPTNHSVRMPQETNCRALELRIGRCPLRLRLCVLR